METVRIPVKYIDLQDGETKFKYEDYPILDPHSIVTFLMESAGLKIPEEHIRQYWQHAAEHGEPFAANVDHSSVPLGLYGDSARVNTTFGHVNLIGIFVNLVLWCPRSVRSSRFLVFTIAEHKCWKHHSLDLAYRRIVWSINSLMSGAHPDRGPYGEPLPAHLEALSGRRFAYRYALTEVRGDWQWHKKTFRFHRCAWNGIKICFQCEARSSSQDHRDLYWMYDDNSWDSNHFNFNQFAAERMPPEGISAMLQYSQNLHYTHSTFCFLSCWFQV